MKSKEQQLAGYAKKVRRLDRREGRLWARQRRENSLEDRITSKLYKNGRNLKSAYIYVLCNPAYPDWYKIGTCINLEDRLKNYQHTDPFRRYEYLDTFFVTDRFRTEKELLVRLSKFKRVEEVKGEWVRVKKYSWLRTSLQSEVARIERIVVREKQLKADSGEQSS